MTAVRPLPAPGAGRIRVLVPRRPVDLRLTLRPLWRGAGDPSTQVAARSAWRASRTPSGPATTEARVDPGAGTITVTAWGPGADWALEQAPALLGLLDDDAGFVPTHPVVRDLHRRLGGLRLCRSGAVVEALVRTVVEQKVTGIESRRSYARLVAALGDPAPGPVGLLVPPSPARLLATPSYAFHRFGIERRRAETVLRVASAARRLEEAAALPGPEARRRLLAVPGVGPWSAAEVAMSALGDPDAVSVGDYHLPDHVCWALAGEVRGDDARMLELLAPFPGHRGRIVRLVEAGAPAPPRFGPRMTVRDIRRL